jgi:hypothetical protein
MCIIEFTYIAGVSKKTKKSRKLEKITIKKTELLKKPD